MKATNVQKVTFAWASTVIGSMGAIILVDERDIGLGLALMGIALAIEVVREVLKKYDLQPEKIEEATE